MKSGVISNKIRIEQLKTQILELTGQRHQQVSTYLNELSIVKTVLKNQIKFWRDKYYIVTPINGIITLASIIPKDVFLPQGKQVCSIVPLTSPRETGTYTRPQIKTNR